MGHSGREICTKNSISAKTNQEGIESTDARKQLWAHCPKIYSGMLHSRRGLMWSENDHHMGCCKRKCTSQYNTPNQHLQWWWNVLNFVGPIIKERNFDLFWWFDLGWQIDPLTYSFLLSKRRPNSKAQNPKMINAWLSEFYPKFDFAENDYKIRQQESYRLIRLWVTQPKNTFLINNDEKILDFVFPNRNLNLEHI